jgi:hypothetical protein
VNTWQPDKLIVAAVSSGVLLILTSAVWLYCRLRARGRPAIRYVLLLSVSGGLGPGATMLAALFIDIALLDFGYQHRHFLNNRFVIPAATLLGMIGGVATAYAIIYYWDPACFRPERALAADYDERVAPPVVRTGRQSDPGR